jgi:long-chain acyl-CoA synthetase
MTDDTIISLFFFSAEKYKGNTAFNYFDRSWVKVTYGEFLVRTQGIALYLINLGIQKGASVAIVSENRHEWCSAYFAILMAGGIAVPIDAQLGPDEIRNLLNDSGTVLTFCSEKTKSNIPVSCRAISFDSGEFMEILHTSGTGSVPELRPEDVASIVYTSGTTGVPKGVTLTHRNFCSDARALTDAGVVTHEDNVLSILPLHHTYPFMCTFLVPLFLGATITYPIGMKGPELVSTMKERGVSALVAVPQLLELMRNSMFKKIEEMPVSALLFLLLRVSGFIRRLSGINAGKAIFSSAHKALGDRFRFFACGGARLDPQVMRDLEAIGFTVLEGYGLTETSPVVTFNPVTKRKAGSVGIPLPSVDLKISRSSDTGEGEIAVKGPMVMKGYYKRPEATQEVIHDGWFLTGDLGHLDSDGYLFITGRSKEVIVLSSGKNVYPEDVEREYLKIPLVGEICVTGIEQRGTAESLHGIVVPDFDEAKREKIGNISDALGWQINQVSASLPPYMRLKGFTLVTEHLPRTRLGKLRRYQIKESHMQYFGKMFQRKEDTSLLSDETGRKVVECITHLLREKTTVSSSDNLDLDLGLDSLQRLEMVVAIEEKFSIKLSDTFASELHTVGELVQKIKELQSTGVLKISSGGEITSEDISGEDKKSVGLQQGRTEWVVTVCLLATLRLILKTFFRLEVKGIRNLPKAPFIVAPNHCSNMDGFVVGAAVPFAIFRVMYFQGLRIYFTGWWLPALFARLAHAIPIDPETFLSRAFKLSSYVLDNGRILCIFPEGGRSIDGNIMEFKKGIGILALQHHTPVVPALIEGSYEALPRGSLWPKFRKVRITFGKPFHAAEFDLSRKPDNIDKYQFFADEVRKRVKKLNEEEE